MFAAYLTTAGVMVLNKVMASHGSLRFTKAELGDGECTSEAECRARTSLKKKVADAIFAGARFEGGEAKLTVQYINTNLETGFFVDEIGIYVQDPDTSEQVLYCYATFGDTPDWIAPKTSAIYTRSYDITTIISNVDSVQVNISPSALIDNQTFNDALNYVNTALKAIAIENDVANRAHDNRLDGLDKGLDDANALIVQKEAVLQEEITQKESSLQNEMRGLDDHQAKHDHMIMVTIFEELYGVIRNLDARLTTAEAQLSSIVDNP